MAYSVEEVAAYIAANPQLSPDELRRLAAENGVSPEILSQASNGALAVSGPTAPYQSSNGIMATPVRDNTGSQYTAGQVTLGELRGWLDANPNVDDRQIAMLMQQYKVDPQVMAEATGIPYGDVVDRYQTGLSQNIPTGQVGFEESLRQGLSDATGTLRGAETGARSDIDAALGRINQLYGVNIDELRNAGAAAQQQVTQGFGRAEDYYKPFQEGGTTAFNQQLALSGAMGQDAFNSANIESPYTAFLREQGMRANLAGAAATGGLGGGNVQKELQRFGQGLASQGLQQQFNNLGVLSGMGLNGAQGAAQAATGGAAANADIGINTANNITAQRGAQAGYEGQAGAGLANIGMQTGNSIANMQYGTGQDVASQRARTGEMLANQYQNAAINQGNLLSGQGDYLSNLTGNTYGNLINMNNTAAQTAAGNQIDLAGSVGNLQTGFATNAGNLINGQQLAQANLPSWQGQIANTLGAAGAGWELGDMAANGRQNGSQVQVRESQPSYTSPGFVGSGQLVSPNRFGAGQLQQSPLSGNSSGAGYNYGRIYG